MLVTVTPIPSDRALDFNLFAPLGRPAPVRPEQLRSIREAMGGAVAVALQKDGEGPQVVLTGPHANVAIEAEPEEVGALLRATLGWQLCLLDMFTDGLAELAPEDKPRTPEGLDAELNAELDLMDALGDALEDPHHGIMVQEEDGNWPLDVQIGRAEFRADNVHALKLCRALAAVARSIRDNP